MHGQSLHLRTSCLVAMACMLHEFEFVDEMAGSRRIRRGRLRAVLSRTQLPSVGSLHAEPTVDSAAATIETTATIRPEIDTTVGDSSNS